MIRIVKLDDRTELYEMDRGPRFKRFEAAFGWMPHGPDSERKAVHALVVVGEKEDDTWTHFEEYMGPLGQIFEDAISAKDRLWLPRIWCDPTGINHIIEARGVDGLTQYKGAGRDIHGHQVYVEKNPEVRWPYFTERRVCSLNSVPDHVHADLAAGYERIRTAINRKGQGQLRYHTDIKEAAWCTENHPNPKEIFDHPVVKALSYAIWALERFRKLPDTKLAIWVKNDSAWKPPYGNF